MFKRKPTTKLVLGDCLDVMKDIPDGSVNMILCDLPYGTTACKWDTVIPFDLLWQEYNRIIMDNCAIVLTASQPFTSNLVMSNIKMFKYEISWNKVYKTGFQIAKIKPLTQHENVLIFGKGKILYNPQMQKRDKLRIVNGLTKSNQIKLGKTGSYKRDNRVLDAFYPTSLIKFSNADHSNTLHPTQKPLKLMEYLIKTYTNNGNIVLDNCMGSGTTGVACKNLNRSFIGIEKDEKYFEIAKERINNV